MLAKWTLAVLAAAGAAPALAQLDSLRGTIPGSLHQCEATNLFFFDSSNTRPLSVLFLPSSEVPDSIRSGAVTLDQAQQYSPLLALSDIETPDAQQYNFELQIEQGAVFEVFAFLPDGEGKALSLTRTVTTPLPGASSCLTNVPTSIAGAGATTAVSAQSTAASSSAAQAADSSSGMMSSSMATMASSSSSRASQSGGSSSTSTSAPASSSSAAAGAAGGSSGASSAGLGSIDRAVVLAWTAAVGGAALVGAGLLA
ncbi:hypothetical protein JCM9279_001195 [Rhodotorula babjevae]